MRLPPDVPELPTDDHEVWFVDRVVFLGFREQCEDRARLIPGSVVRRRGAEVSA